jgi:hypothetical protein
MLDTEIRIRSHQAERSDQNVVQFQFVHITPYPGFPGLIGTDEGMLRFLEVFGGVLILGRIAAAHMSAAQAQAQVNPAVACFNAFLANVFVGFLDLDLVQVGAFVRHGILLGRFILQRGK